MSNIIVIGAGMVGSAMAIDMAKNHKVTLTDISNKVLEKIKSKHTDISVETLDVRNHDLLKQTIAPPFPR